jgi:hypothetical protein
MGGEKARTYCLTLGTVKALREALWDGKNSIEGHGLAMAQKATGTTRDREKA